MLTEEFVKKHKRCRCALNTDIDIWVHQCRDLVIEHGCTDTLFKVWIVQARQIVYVRDHLIRDCS